MATPSVDELLDALRTALAPEHGPEDALTSEEWAELMRVNVKTARLKIKALLRGNRMQRVVVWRDDLRGVTQPVSAYRLLN